MQGSNAWLVLATAIAACAPTPQFVSGSADGDAGGDGGGDANDDADDGATGAVEPEPAGDGCDASDCSPELLWIHEVPSVPRQRVSFDSLGRPLWVADESESRVHVLAYDPATDTETVVAGPIDGSVATATDVRESDDGFRVLSNTVGGVPRLARVRGSDVSWSIEFNEGWTPIELERGDDGVSYLLGTEYQQPEVLAIDAEGAVLWHSDMRERNDGKSTRGFTITGLHPGGISYVQQRHDGAGGPREWLVTHVENGQVVSQVDLAPALPLWSAWIVPRRSPGGWIAATGFLDEAGIWIAELDAEGTLEWLRSDPPAEGFVLSSIATATRVAVASKAEGTSTTCDFRSYERDGRLRGKLRIDLGDEIEAVPGYSFVLPDGTIVLQLDGRLRRWLVGVRP